MYLWYRNTDLQRKWGSAPPPGSTNRHTSLAFLHPRVAGVLQNRSGHPDRVEQAEATAVHETEVQNKQRRSGKAG